MRTRSQRALAGAAACAVALSAVGVLAFRVPAARRADARALAGFRGLGGSGRLDALAVHIASATPVLFVLSGLAMVAIALLRGRRRVALAVPLAMGGAVGASELLKMLIATSRHTAVLAGAQISGTSWPSGHATAAMIAALCAVLVAPPRLRGAVALAGSVAVLAVSYSMLLLGRHYPSDILGGFLLAGLTMALTLSVLWRGEAASPARLRLRRAGVSWLLLPSAAAAAAVAGGLALHAFLAPGGMQIGGSLIGGASALAAVAAALTGTLRAALRAPGRALAGPLPRRRRRQPGA